MNFRISGLDPAPFVGFYGVDGADLARHGVRRVIADKTPGFPDRVELRDAAPGEAVLLLNYLHQPATTAFRASHAIFVREGADRPVAYRNEVPAVLRGRVISLRGFDAEGEMQDAELVDGRELEAGIERLLNLESVSYIQAHFAKFGCYAALIERE
jgi:hypothetical protein